MFFELQLKFLFIMNVVLGFLKIKDIPSMIILHTSQILFLYFVYSCVVCSPNVEEVSIKKKFWVVFGFNEIFV